MTIPGRTAAGLLATTLTAGLTAGLVGLGAAPASAAYETLESFHRSTIEACRTTTAGGEPAVRFRVDSREAGHPHNGGLTRTRDGAVARTFMAKPAVGRVSAARTVVLAPNDRLSYFIGDANAGAGGDLRRGSLPRC